jgi:hypothetical protein
MIEASSLLLAEGKQAVVRRERLGGHCWLDDSRSMREVFVLETLLQHE